MRKDTKTFLLTILGIPLMLSAAWGFHAADEASTVVFEREPEALVEPVIAPEPEPVIHDEGTVEPTKPAPKPVPVSVPVTVPTSSPAVVATPAPEPVVEPAPKVEKKKSRRTRAS